ncbi:MAG: hypothetical protein NZ534_13085, partial [Bacteroidia bacterium]|nr:hypothetical protein [Bacteroidia bacterium]
TGLFDDGKTSLNDYLNQELKNKTTCCGADAAGQSENLQVQIFVNEEGLVTGTRVLSGKNECVRQAVGDMLKYVRWKKSDKPTFFRIVNLKLPACGGKANDNKYVPIAPPPGWTEPVASKPKTDKNIQPDVIDTRDRSAGGGVSVTRTTSEAPKSAASSSSGAVDPTSLCPDLEKKLKPIDLPPPIYVSRGNLTPGYEHQHSPGNMPGPRLKAPEYYQGDLAMAIYIKSHLRNANICGLAHVLAELTVAPDGSVSEFRIFRTNNEIIAATIPPILCGLKFKKLPFRQYYYLEFKTDIDCPGR